MAVFWAIWSLCFVSFLLPDFLLSSENYPCKFKQNLWNSKHNWYNFLFDLIILKTAYTVNENLRNNCSCNSKVTCKELKTKPLVQYIYVNKIILLLKLWSILIALVITFSLREWEKNPPTSMVMSITIIHSRRRACFSFRWFRIRSVSSMQCWSFSFITCERLQIHGKSGFRKWNETTKYRNAIHRRAHWTELERCYHSSAKE